MVLQMTKKLKIEILQDGTIKAKTDGVMGKECLKYIELLEKLSESKTVDSKFLKEFYTSKTPNTQISEKIKNKQLD